MLIVCVAKSLSFVPDPNSIAFVFISSVGGGDIVVGGVGDVGGVGVGGVGVGGCWDSKRGGGGEGGGGGGVGESEGF